LVGPLAAIDVAPLVADGRGSVTNVSADASGLPGPKCVRIINIISAIEARTTVQELGGRKVRDFLVQQCAGPYSGPE
jgi:hypothetical protein